MSKQTMQTNAAKDSYNVNVSPRAQKSSQLSAQSPKHQFPREPVNSNHVFFKPTLNSPLPRHHPPPLDAHKPRPSDQTPHTRDRQSQERHELLPNTTSQRVDPIQRGVASRNSAKPNRNGSQMRAM